MSRNVWSPSLFNNLKCLDKRKTQCIALNMIPSSVATIALGWYLSNTVHSSLYDLKSRAYKILLCRNIWTELLCFIIFKFLLWFGFYGIFKHFFHTITFIVIYWVLESHRWENIYSMGSGYIKKEILLKIEGQKIQVAMNTFDILLHYTFLFLFSHS